MSGKSYPKLLSKEEFVKWILNIDFPTKIGATQISENVVILRAIKEKKK